MTLPTPTPPGINTYLDIARARQSLPSALFDTPVHTLKVEQPTLVVFHGDWHLGAAGTDYNQFEQDVGMLLYARKKLKRQLLLVGMGDYIDGYLPTGTPKNPYQVLSPKEQRDAVIQVMKELQYDIVIEGDHDEWHSHNYLEHSWLSELADQLGSSHMQWGGEIHFHLENRTTQRWLVRHRYKGSRTRDFLQPHKQMVNELGSPGTKVAALGHFHSYPGTYHTYGMRREEGKLLAVQSGTYKIKDDYGKKIGAYEGEYGVPAIIIEPDGKLIPFERFEDALLRMV